MFAGRAARVRDIGVVTAMYGSTLFIALTLLASMATAVVYGLGGTLVIHHIFEIGTLVALTALLARLYGPITALSNVQVDVMTALVSFDRVFEVLDLKPLIEEKPGAVALRATPRPARPQPRAASLIQRRPSTSATSRSTTRPRARSRWPRWSRSRSRCPSTRVPPSRCCAG